MYEKSTKTIALQKLTYTFNAIPIAIPVVFVLKTSQVSKGLQEFTMVSQPRARC